MEEKLLKNEIIKLKKEKNFFIASHNYQRENVQEIADIVGDSLLLSQISKNTKQEKIILCGVDFMAESIKILSPQKRVFLPVKSATCPMANMVDKESLRIYKKNNPNRKIVAYVNTSAEIKSLVDICCTSSNALKIIDSMKNEKILFLPDKNLGNYIKSKRPLMDIEVWNGFCITHEKLEKEELLSMKKKYPKAKVLAHPECNINILNYADFIGSTSQIINEAKNSDYNEYIIATENGILKKLNDDNPQKHFYLASQNLVCQNMKKINLKSIYDVLLEEKNEIFLNKEIIERAYNSLEKMIKIS